MKTRTNRLFNGRVLLEFAAQEISTAGAVDADELKAAIRATGGVLGALCEASCTLGVAPPELPELEPWVRRIAEAADTHIEDARPGVGLVPTTTTLAASGTTHFLPSSDSTLRRSSRPGHPPH